MLFFFKAKRLLAITTRKCITQRLSSARMSLQRARGARTINYNFSYPTDYRAHITTSHAPKTTISPKRSENFNEWYKQVIKAADLAEDSPVPGFMVVKPWGYAIWENMQRHLDKKLKATGHKNIYCPLFIPISLFEKEASHVAGFAKECAIVTHGKLEHNAAGQLVPVKQLKEPLVVRPTSETLMGALFSKWIKSHRDLPVLINQWANVVRLEIKFRMFLRTSEFLWQEGHTAHANSEEAMQEVQKILDIYVAFVEKHLAIPVIKGEKTENEKFSGAISTYTIEAMMQDGKALQTGTSHFLGQNFSKMFNIKYNPGNGKEEYVWTTSWGVSTRLIGALIMSHSDDNGLVLPPKISPIQVAIIASNWNDTAPLYEYCHQLSAKLQKVVYEGENISVEIDKRDSNAGQRGWEWYTKGVPIRIEIGAKEITKRTVFIGRRDRPYREKYSLTEEEFITNIPTLLSEIQNEYYLRATIMQNEKTKTVSSKEEFEKFFPLKNKNQDHTTPPTHNKGFLYAYWKGNAELEQRIKEERGATIRCLPSHAQEKGTCIFTGEKESRLALFAYSY